MLSDRAAGHTLRSLYSPALKRAIALATVDAAAAVPGTMLSLTLPATMGRPELRENIGARDALAVSPGARFNRDMRHARPEDLDRLEPLLELLRRLEGLKEKSRGTFYRGSRAFLHFHEHEGGFFADVRLQLSEDFERLPATTATDRKTLLSLVTKALSA